MPSDNTSLMTFLKSRQTAFCHLQGTLSLRAVRPRAESPCKGCVNRTDLSRSGQSASSRSQDLSLLKAGSSSAFPPFFHQELLFNVDADTSNCV